MARFKLADRMSELPDVSIVEDASDTLPCTVSVYLRPGFGALQRRRTPAQLYCQIGHSGIRLQGLRDSDRHQVLSRGWGSLDGCNVLLHLPRDDDELVVCWDILCRAYETILHTPAAPRLAATVLQSELPEHSHTILC